MVAAVLIVVLAVLAGVGVIAYAKSSPDTTQASPTTCAENTTPKLETSVVKKLGDPRANPLVAESTSSNPEATSAESSAPAESTATPFNEQTERTVAHPNVHKDTKKPGCQFSSAELESTSGGGQ